MNYRITAVLFPLVLVCCVSCSHLQPAKERITVDLRAPRIPAGSADAQFDRTFSRDLQKQEMSISYFPNDDVICLQFRVNFQTSYVFWSKTNRAAFMEALDKYKADYEQRSLGSSPQKTKRAYGTLRGYFMWETHQFALLNTSYPEYELGYYFKNQSPYFSITIREAPNETETAKEDIRTNPNLVMYFTRAQAEQLAAIFDPDFIQKLRQFQPPPAYTPPPPDAYNEKEY